jgi:hypothetical protein
VAAHRSERGAAQGRGGHPARCGGDRGGRPGRGGQDPARPRGAGGFRGHAATVVWAQGNTAARPFPLGAFAGLLEVPVGDPAETIGRALGELARPLVLAVDDAHPYPGP